MMGVVPTEVRLEFLGFQKDTQQEHVVGFDSKVFVHFHGLHPHLFELTVPSRNRDFTGIVVFERTLEHPHFQQGARPAVLGTVFGQFLGMTKTVGSTPRGHEVIPEHFQLIHHVTCSI